MTDKTDRVTAIVKEIRENVDRLASDKATKIAYFFSQDDISALEAALNQATKDRAKALSALDRLAGVAFINTNSKQHPVEEHVELVETIRDFIEK